MSAGLQGFIQGISGAASQAADRKYEQDQAQKKSEWGLYSKIAFDNRSVADGGPTDEQRKYAMDQIGKRGGKDVKQGLQKFSSFRSLVDSISGKGGAQQPQQQGAQQGQPQARGPLPAPQMQPTGAQPKGEAQPAPVDEKPKGGGPLAAPQMPAAATESQIQGAQDTAAAAATKRNITNEDAEYGFWKEKGEKLGLEGRDLAQYAATKGVHIPPQQKRIADKGVARPGEDPSTGKQYEGIWDHIVEPDGSETWAKRPDAKGGQQIRSVPHSLSREDAMSLAKQGSAFETQDGKEINIEDLPPNMGLQAMVSGSKMFWVPITPNQKAVTVGNIEYATTPYNVTKIGQAGDGAPRALGVQKTGTSGTSQQLAVDPSTNKLTVNDLRHTTTPNTPGAQPAPQQGRPQPQGAAPAAHQAGPPPQPKRGPLAAPPAAQQQSPPQAKSDTGGAVLRGAPVAMFNQQTQKAVPLMESVSQVFGDPAHPEIKPLLGYADMADDPKSKERLGKALKLTFDSLTDASGGANVAVGAGPVSVNAGGFGQWLQNAVGIPQAIAQQHAKIMSDAVKDLTPEEREAYDAEMTAFSTAVGLRSLTKASAAQGSVRAIERELPLIGVNVASKKQFYDQMQRLAELSINGVRTFPNVNGSPVGFDKGLADRINGMPAELKRLKDGGQPKRGPLADPSGKQGGSSDMERMEYNGDTYERKKGTGGDWKKVKKAA